MSSSPRYILNEASDVIFERFEEEVVAIQLGTGAYHRVSGCGVDAFALFASQPSADEMVEALAEHYEVSAESIAADVESWLRHLRDESLILQLAPQARSGSRPRLPHTESHPAYSPPLLQPFRDLQDLFLMDPVHDVGPLGWPEPRPATEANEVESFRYKSRGQEAMLVERFDDETVAINLSSGVYHSLSGPAEDIFLLLDSAPSLAELTSALSQKYHAPKSDISAATQPFLDSLVEAGLVDRGPLDAADELRTLTLAKPGAGLAFVVPSLDTFRDQLPSAQMFGAAPGGNRDQTRKRIRIPKSGILLTFVGGEAAIVNLGSGDYYLANPSAATVLRLLQQQPTSTELLNALSKIYEVDRAGLAASVLLLIDNLCREGLVEQESAGEESVIST